MVDLRFSLPLALLLASLFFRCSPFRWLFSPVDGPEPCDPTYSVYQGGIHYIDRSFLNDEGRIDYKKLLRAVRPQDSPCDPLKKESGQPAG